VARGGRRWAMVELVFGVLRGGSSTSANAVRVSLRPRAGGGWGQRGRLARKEELGRRRLKGSWGG
jgi:hypothetical protein